MAVEDALHSLSGQSNQQIEWAIGSLLRRRAERPDWRQCSVLQQLETGRNIAAWNELFRMTRQALHDERDLPRKAESLLRPDKASFDENLEDFIAEMMAVVCLRHWGHTDITLPAEGAPITTDVVSAHGASACVTEAKNLREPNSLAYIAFARWHHNQAADPKAFDFEVELLSIDEPFEDLTPEQAVNLRALIDSLPARPRPSVFQRSLPDDRTIRLRVADGKGGMIHHGPGPFLVGPVVDECRRAVVMKLMEPTRKALTQLYSDAVPADYRRLLFVRWKPPEAIGVLDEAGNVRTIVRDNFQKFLCPFFRKFALVIAHTYENLDNVPPPAWQD